jgi:hypothetical protein
MGLSNMRRRRLNIFIGPCIAFIMRQKITVALLVCVITAGDDMDGNTSAGKLVECGEGAGSHSGRHETGAMRQHESDALRRGRREGTHQYGVRINGMPGNQDAIESWGETHEQVRETVGPSSETRSSCTKGSVW